jgi:hypothetical protein
VYEKPALVREVVLQFVVAGGVSPDGNANANANSNANSA